MVSEKITHFNTLLHSVPLDLERIAVLREYCFLLLREHCSLLLREQEIFLTSCVLLNMKSVPLCVLASSRSRWWGGEIDFFGCCFRMKIVPPICVFSSMQHNATQCITLQHTAIYNATHCNTEQITVLHARHTHKRIEQCVAVCCSVLQCVAACCSVMQCVFLSPFVATFYLGL